MSGTPQPHHQRLFRLHYWRLTTRALGRHVKPLAVRTTALACIVGEKSPYRSLTSGQNVLWPGCIS